MTTKVRAGGIASNTIANSMLHTSFSVDSSQIANGSVDGDALANTINLSSKTLTLPTVNDSRVIDVSIIENSTRTIWGSFANGQIFFSGNFTKRLASTKIIATTTSFWAGYYSGNAGMGLKLTANSTDYWRYGVGFQYDGGWSANSQTTIVVGQSSWDGIPAGTHTMGLGTNCADGGANNKPGYCMNPNSNATYGESRNQQFVSSIIIYEVV